MLRLTKNELFIGFTISVILSLFANFTLLMRRYDMAMNVEASIFACAEEKSNFWFSICWFFFFSFLLFIFYRWVYKWGNKTFQCKGLIVTVFTMTVSSFMAFGLYKAYPVSHQIVIGKVNTVYINTVYPSELTNGFVAITKMPAETPDIVADSIATPDSLRVVVSTMSSANYEYPLLIEHVFVLLTFLLSMFLFRLLDKKQEIKLAYEKIKVEKLQNSYNALMGQINPHFFFNSLNGLHALVRTGEQKKTLEYLEGLSNVFRYILQSNHKTLVTLDEELNFIYAYTYLLSVRYENRLFFSFRIEDTCLQKRLPVLSLLPLVENAVKHNIISKQYPLRIEIYTTSESQLVVFNPIQLKMEEYIRNGIGLKNLQGRYQMLTGECIQIDDTAGCFKVTLPLLKALI